MTDIVSGMATAEQVKESKLSRLLNRRSASRLASKDGALLDPRIGQKFFREKGAELHPAFGELTEWDEEENKFQTPEQHAVKQVTLIARIINHC
jgi:hypothetical protein